MSQNIMIKVSNIIEINPVENGYILRMQIDYSAEAGMIWSGAYISDGTDFQKVIENMLLDVNSDHAKVN